MRWCWPWSAGTKPAAASRRRRAAAGPRGPEPGRRPAGGQHPVQVAEQAEPGHVGGAAPAARAPGWRRVEQRHGRHAAASTSGGAAPRLSAVATRRCRAPWSGSAGRRAAGRWSQRVRVGQARHGQAVLGHRIVDRVPARDEHRPAATCAPPRSTWPRMAMSSPSPGQAARLTANSGRPPIAYTSDSAFAAAIRPQSRVVDDRGEEVGGQHQRALVVQAETAAAPPSAPDEQVAEAGPIGDACPCRRTAPRAWPAAACTRSPRRATARSAGGRPGSGSGQPSPSPR